MNHDERLDQLEKDRTETKVLLAEIKTLLTNHLTHHEDYLKWLPVVLFLGNLVANWLLR